MAIAVYASDDDYGYMRYGMPSSRERSLLRDRLESTARSSGLADTDFYRRAVEKFESIDFDRIERKINAVKRRVVHMFDRDEIVPMIKIGEFQQAGPNQARWLRANPRAKKLFDLGMMAGWEDTLSADVKGLSGRDHPDYQQVMHGRPEFDADGNATIVEYFHLYDQDGRTELTHSQQDTIESSMWANFNTWLDDGQDDPSDSENGSL